ncbi:uncharacterized protein BDW43DRAFT_313298 [Aspergillus alliaceus]|uniref:uncharacterized protein n=1 Tax=Petromyces alliaceus TaxID=209559 RepID=UPI0012A71579|nr:uncharacterized protein BDW43DRAFT_313298 [Aspergillus alliaceus]KAB8231219.1 hypothetical protein BDW43DRAFT_313298 [Aspergillus alliaceus]
MEEPDSNIIWALAADLDRLTPHAEVHEISRVEKSFETQIERVYKCQRALNGVPIRVGNLHHANVLVKTTDDRLYFIGFTGERSGPGSTEFFEVKSASEALDNRSRFTEHNHTKSGTTRRHWLKAKTGQAPGSPTTLGDLVRFCETMAAAKDYHVLKHNCQHGQAALLHYMDRASPKASTAESFQLKTTLTHTADPVQQAVEASLFNQAKSHQQLPFNFVSTIDIPTARQSDLHYMPFAPSRPQLRDHQPSGFAPTTEHPASGSDQRPPPYTGRHTPRPNYSSGSLPEEEPRIRVESREGTGRFLTATVVGGAAGMGYSGASAMVFHGVSLSIKLGVGISAGSPAVTVGVAATALNPVGAAWMAGVFVVSAGTLVYGALKSQSND